MADGTRRRCPALIRQHGAPELSADDPRLLDRIEQIVIAYGCGGWGRRRPSPSNRAVWSQVWDTAQHFFRIRYVRKTVGEALEKLDADLGYKDAFLRRHWEIDPYPQQHTTRRDVAYDSPWREMIGYLEWRIADILCAPRVKPRADIDGLWLSRDESGVAKIRTLSGDDDGSCVLERSLAVGQIQVYEVMGDDGTTAVPLRISNQESELLVHLGDQQLLKTSKVTEPRPIVIPDLRDKPDPRVGKRICQCGWRACCSHHHLSGWMRDGQYFPLFQWVERAINGQHKADEVAIRQKSFVDNGMLYPLLQEQDPRVRRIKILRTQCPDCGAWFHGNACKCGRGEREATETGVLFPADQPKPDDLRYMRPTQRHRLEESWLALTEPDGNPLIFCHWQNKWRAADKSRCGKPDECLGLYRLIESGPVRCVTIACRSGTPPSTIMSALTMPANPIGRVRPCATRGKTPTSKITPGKRPISVWSKTSRQEAFGHC